MSASSKKKLRNEQEAAKMTERQLAEQKEAKKLKALTTTFTLVLAVIVVVAVVFAATQFITNSGIREKNTAAVSVGDVELSNAELNYYFIDAVNEFYRNYGSYISMFGLDITKPLNEQVTNEETGATWADDFLTTAKSKLQNTMALVNAANAAGHTLSEDEIVALDSNMVNLESYALLYGYTGAEQYLKAVYGYGATVNSYREYCEMNALASSYYNAYANSLTYDDAALRAAEAENYAQYSVFSYNSYYMNVNSFLEGGTTDEEGNTTYTDEERADAVAAAEEAAKSLVSDEIVTVEDLDAAIATLSINAESETAVSSTPYKDVAYTSVSATILDWVSDASRKAGDKTYIANVSTSTDEEGNETSTINGYYVVMFGSVNDNNYPLVNVRHILVGFEGGTYDSSTGTTVYSEEEKLAARMKAEDLLAQWEGGKASEETFAAMANEHSTDGGSNTNGGLYENVFPGQMVTNFNDWCFAEGREAGDTGIVESDFGYHIMYYVGDSETLYRDFMIENELRNADTTEWYNALVEATTVTELNTDYISKDLVLSGN